MAQQTAIRPNTRKRNKRSHRPRVPRTYRQRERAARYLQH